VIHAAGHTPGSQIVVAAVRDQAGTLSAWVFSGDVTNTIDGIRTISRSRSSTGSSSCPRTTIAWASSGAT
jgi:glyoxylase-like metal-dependent hydrolase (beta-lactamase superfamily II)